MIFFWLPIGQLTIWHVALVLLNILLHSEIMWPSYHGRYCRNGKYCLSIINKTARILPYCDCSGKRNRQNNRFKNNFYFFFCFHFQLHCAGGSFACSINIRNLPSRRTQYASCRYDSSQMHFWDQCVTWSRVYIWLCFGMSGGRAGERKNRKESQVELVNEWK